MFFTSQDQELAAATDGSYLGNRYFRCPANKGLFVKRRNCRRDSRFPAPETPLNQVERCNSIGGLIGPVHRGGWSQVCCHGAWCCVVFIVNVAFTMSWRRLCDVCVALTFVLPWRLCASVCGVGE